MKHIEIVTDKKLRRKPAIARFSYEFLQINPITKEEKWIKGGLIGSTYLKTILSTYVKSFIKFKFNGVRNAIITIPYGYKEAVQEKIRLMGEEEDSIKLCDMCDEQEAYGILFNPSDAEQEKMCPECLSIQLFCGEVRYDDDGKEYIITSHDLGWYYKKIDENSADLRIQRFYYDGKRDGYIGFTEPYLKRRINNEV